MAFLPFLFFLGRLTLIAAASSEVLMCAAVVFLAHLDTRAAVLSDLVGVGALHQPQADVCMSNL